MKVKLTNMLSLHSEHAIRPDEEQLTEKILDLKSQFSKIMLCENSNYDDATSVMD